MSYFDSLQGWRKAADNISDHQNEIEQEAKDRKASDIGQKFDFIDKQLQDAGSGIGGFAGAYHLSRKIYKKVKTAQAKAKEIQGKVQDAKSKITGDSKNEDDAGEKGSENPSEPKMNGTEDNGLSQSSEKLSVPEDADDFSFFPDHNVAGEGVDDIFSGTSKSTIQAAKDVKEGNTTQPELEDDTFFPDSAKAPDPDADAIFADKEGGQLADDPAKLSQADLPQGSGGSSAGADGSGTIKTGPDDADVSALGQSETPLTEEQAKPFTQGEQSTPEIDNAETTGTKGVEPSTDASTSNPAGTSGAEADIKSAADSGSDAAKSALSDLKSGADNVIDQTASSVSKATDAASNVISKGSSALDDAANLGSKIAGGVSDTISAGLDTAGAVLDFLGPVGEIVGAGLALGSFFHDLFGHKKEMAQEDAAQGAKSVIAQGTGISTGSIGAANVKSNVVGTLV